MEGKEETGENTGVLAGMHRARVCTRAGGRKIQSNRTAPGLWCCLHMKPNSEAYLGFPLTDRNDEEGGERELAFWWEFRDEIWRLFNVLSNKSVFSYILYM